jgi:cell division cycle 2-like protein
MRMMNDAEVNEIVSEEEVSEEEVEVEVEKEKSKSPRSDKLSSGKSVQSGDSRSTSRSGSRTSSEERVEPKRPRRPSSSSSRTSRTGDSGHVRKQGTPGGSERSIDHEDSQDLDDRTPEFGDLPIEKPQIQKVTYFCALQGCRSVEEFECLNKIEEGAYGVVYRAKDKKSSINALFSHFN